MPTFQLGSANQRAIIISRNNYNSIKIKNLTFFGYEELSFSRGWPLIANMPVNSKYCYCPGHTAGFVVVKGIVIMKLYSSATSPFSHRCRIMLYEKGMTSRSSMLTHIPCRRIWPFRGPTKTCQCWFSVTLSCMNPTSSMNISMSACLIRI